MVKKWVFLAVLGVAAVFAVVLAWPYSDQRWLVSEPGVPVAVAGNVYGDDPSKPAATVDFGPEQAQELWALIRSGVGPNENKCRLYAFLTLTFDNGRSYEIQLGCCGVNGRDGSIQCDRDAIKRLATRWIALSNAKTP